MKIGRVKIIAFLDLEQNSSFLDGHELVFCITVHETNTQYSMFDVGRSVLDVQVS